MTELVSPNSYEVYLKQKEEEREERERILQDIERKERERMKNAQKRLHSFTSSSFAVGDAQRLAKAGFYCTFCGNTECFSCELRKSLSFWREGHDPETVHREESPDCKFITGQSDNVPIERWMNYEQTRLDSFKSGWLGISVAQHLAKAGFYAWGYNTECFSCKLYKPSSFWLGEHDPETVHREESPDCKFITGQSDNVPIEKWMQYEQNRLDSFHTIWSDHLQLNVSVAQRLAKTGFYYLPLEDTNCFSCGLSKHSSFWHEHDPETVHREESPDCKFITGQIDNVPIEKSMKYEQNRLDSFDSWWLNYYHMDVSVAQRLAKAGFYRWFGGI